MDKNYNRNRITYGLLASVVIGIGLTVRKMAPWMPDWINFWIGDAIWAVMIYLMLAFLLPGWRPLKLALFALLCCFAVECSQLYQAAWINAIRSTRFGALVLGHGFLFSDLLAYTAGITIVTITEVWTMKKD
ncbi:MAG: DUF2809 domain-containing protein [Sphingobacteriales bacterium]|nr:MAG: DUF2809 domain-containing protein [Sphingobacteriales bacterium]